MKNTKRYLLTIILSICMICSFTRMQIYADTSQGTIYSLDTIPDYSESAYVEINGNIPYFTEDDLTTESFEIYSDLDDLGRCGEAYACIGTDLMPTEERGEIGSIKPTGWVQNKYEGVVDSEPAYLYNRCHLIAYCLTAENANEKNLITGTRYLNVDGMLPFETMIAEYVEDTGNHVLYRITPIFEDNNLLASGVLMEALSVEDDGNGIQFCVYCYNVQPGVTIDYATGENWLEGDEAETAESSSEQTYILNTNTKKFHSPDCSSVDQMSEKNKQEYTGTREELIAQGYDPCGNCNP